MSWIDSGKKVQMEYSAGNYSQFHHSVPVPPFYKVASKILRLVKEGKDTLKNLIFKERHVEIKKTQAIIIETLKREKIIGEIIDASLMLKNEPGFNPWLAKVLVYDLLWGKPKFTSKCKPIQTILRYEEKLRELLPTYNDKLREIVKCRVTKPRYVRVNTLKITMEEAICNFRDEGWILIPFLNKEDYDGFLLKINQLKEYEFMVDLHVPDLLIFPPKTQFHQHEAYKSSCILLQDKASCIPVSLLNPPPGSTVLDMCAAPGMKTTQIAAFLKNSGTVHAFELNERRGKLLEKFVEDSDASCVKIEIKDALSSRSKDYPELEYILVDPSCSGSGITDRLEIEELNLTQKGNRLMKLIGFQTKLLRHALSFRQAKRIVYSTCSVNPEENEDVVRQVIQTCLHFRLVDARSLLKSWNDTNSELFPEVGKLCLYATPEKDRTNGFFVAVFERLQKGETNPFLDMRLFDMYYGIHGKYRKDNNQTTLEKTHSHIVDNYHKSFKKNPNMQYKNYDRMKEKSLSNNLAHPQGVFKRKEDSLDYKENEVSYENSKTLKIDTIQFQENFQVAEKELGPIKKEDKNYDLPENIHVKKEKVSNVKHESKFKKGNELPEQSETEKSRIKQEKLSLDNAGNIGKSIKIKNEQSHFDLEAVREIEKEMRETKPAIIESTHLQRNKHKKKCMDILENSKSKDSRMSKKIKSFHIEPSDELDNSNIEKCKKIKNNNSYCGADEVKTINAVEINGLCKFEKNTDDETEQFEQTPIMSKSKKKKDKYYNKLFENKKLNEGLISRDYSFDDRSNEVNELVIKSLSEEHKSKKKFEKSYETNVIEVSITKKLNKTIENSKNEIDFSNKVHIPTSEKKKSKHSKESVDTLDEFEESMNHLIDNYLKTNKNQEMNICVMSSEVNEMHMEKGGKTTDTSYKKSKIINNEKDLLNTVLPINNNELQMDLPIVASPLKKKSKKNILDGDYIKETETPNEHDNTETTKNKKCNSLSNENNEILVNISGEDLIDRFTKKKSKKNNESSKKVLETDEITNNLVVKKSKTPKNKKGCKSSATFTDLNEIFIDISNEEYTTLSIKKRSKRNIASCKEMQETEQSLKHSDQHDSSTSQYKNKRKSNAIFDEVDEIPVDLENEGPTDNVSYTKEKSTKNIETLTEIVKPVNTNDNSEETEVKTPKKKKNRKKNDSSNDLSGILVDISMEGQRKTGEESAEISNYNHIKTPMKEKDRSKKICPESNEKERLIDVLSEKKSKKKRVAHDNETSKDFIEENKKISQSNDVRQYNHSITYPNGENIEKFKKKKVSM